MRAWLWDNLEERRLEDVMKGLEELAVPDAALLAGEVTA